VRLIDPDAKAVEIRLLESSPEKSEDGLSFLFSGTDGPEELPDAEDRFIDIDEGARGRIQNFRSVTVSRNNVQVSDPLNKLFPNVCFVIEAFGLFDAGDAAFDRFEAPVAVVESIAFGVIRAAEAGNGLHRVIDKNRSFRNAPELEYPHTTLHLQNWTPWSSLPVGLWYAFNPRAEILPAPSLLLLHERVLEGKA